jgi:hypothetical protein
MRGRVKWVTMRGRAPGGRARAASGRVRHDGARLVALRDWLEAHRVTHVAMEAIGVF